MKIEKANLSVDGETLRITMPLQKVDKERRIVSGFATLDNIDKHGDVVTKEASKKAFSEFLGNVRLMHQPIPAGRVLKFREEEYFDPQSKKVYNGIYVDAYISKGAESIWQMVLDKTLTGFSIGGDNVEAEAEFSKDAGRNIRKVTGYRMNELSLVDNPANAFSNILSIQKSADGQVTAEGSLANVSVENVFYCKKDHDPVALVSDEDSKDCIDCGQPMKNIGWFEGDGEDKVEKVNAIVEKFEADSTEGGESMAQKEKDDEVTTVESAEEVSPKGDEEVVAPEGEEAKTATVVEEENVSVTGTGEAKTEEAKKLNEETKIEDGAVQENDNPLAKMLDDLQQSIQASLDSNLSKSNEAFAQFEGKFTELSAKHADLIEKFGTLTEKVENVEKRFEGIEKSGAFKKSADLGGSEEDSSIQKSSDKKVWGGSIFSVNHL